MVVFLYDRQRLNYHEATAALAKSQAARRIVREALVLLVETARRKEESIS